MPVVQELEGSRRAVWASVSSSFLGRVAQVLADNNTHFPLEVHLVPVGKVSNLSVLCQKVRWTSEGDSR